MIQTNLADAADTAKTYYTVYKDSSKKDVLFLKGEDVLEGDYYLSHDNKLYKIASVDDKQKTGVAEYVKDEELPIYNVKRKKVEETSEKASAAVNKKVGVYHTHNDEWYFTPDGIDSIYGKGGIHDVGKEFIKQLNNLGIQTVYREDLHLPHNSGAYTRSQVTAVAILNEKVDGLFDLHRDSTKRSEYLTKVDGMQMSSIRMVVGASSKNYEENKKFAYSIKSYADAVYPGLIKDIYIGNDNMKFKQNFCKDNNYTFIRTYTVKDISKYAEQQYDEDGNRVSYGNSFKVELNEFQGETKTVIINNLWDITLEKNKTYEFEFMINEDVTNVKDEIEDIFKNSTIVGVKETTKTGLEQIQEPMVKQ